MDAMMEKGPESLVDEQNHDVLKIYRKFLRRNHKQTLGNNVKKKQLSEVNMGRLNTDGDA